MRHFIIVSWMLLSLPNPAAAQVSIQIGVPNVSIGINVPVYPQLVRVPGYPVYYAPNVASNYFFYDGMYWVLQGDDWYVSSWYNGPWSLVPPQAVPVFLLRVPVSYYRRPPPYFHGWSPNAPPRWGEHWGNDWERQHGGWDKWDHRSAPPPAPLPAYQKQYSGNRYPPPDQQPTLHGQNYGYRPKDPTVQQVYEAHGIQGGQQPPKKGNQGKPPSHDEGQSDKGHQGKGGPPEHHGDGGQQKGDQGGQDHKK